MPSLFHAIARVMLLTSVVVCEFISTRERLWSERFHTHPCYNVFPSTCSWLLCCAFNFHLVDSDWPCDKSFGITCYFIKWENSLKYRWSLRWRRSLFEPTGYRLAVRVALAGGGKSICRFVWDILAIAKTLFTLYTLWNLNARFFIVWDFHWNGV
jgi:hypothetical protein